MHNRAQLHGLTVTHGGALYATYRHNKLLDTTAKTPGGGMPRAAGKLNVHIKRYVLTCAVLLLSLVVMVPGIAAESALPAYHVYVDADWSHSYTSSRAIEQGLRTSLSLAGNELDGRPVEIRRLDHRANTRRHLANLQKFAQDPQALALVAGLHSPPLLANKNTINQNCLLTLVAWAAAGPITRSTEPNCIFRLSVDDAIAGHSIVRHAVRKRDFRKLAIVAEDTSWGRFNIRNMSQAAQELDCPLPEVFVFNWGLSSSQARIVLRKAANAGAQAVLLVANPAESVTFARAMADLEQEFKRPFQSHWGCSAGSFVEQVGLERLNTIDLEFIQSSFSFLQPQLPPLALKALERAKQLFGQEIKSAADITPPDAFIHAFDLGLLLAAAAKQAGLSGAPHKDRLALKQALEHLRTPVQGLIKTYHPPFTPWTPDAPQAHEALGAADYAMAHYNQQGHIVLERPWAP